jgi:3D (Asp-Asp-Asp) domain-containing protein
VGEALAAAGVSLQDLDYSKPAETDALPDDGRIIVVRVREEILNENQTIPYNTESTKVDSLDLGEKQVVQQGEFGLQLVRVAIRYEDGVEVSRNNLDTVVLKDPVDQVENVGTKVTAQTVSDTSCGAVQYYRAMDVTTTSYSPCNSDTPNGDCSNTTAIGTPVKHGSLAVFYDWFLILRGTRICIPGYGIGTVEDNGSYPYNHNWIDLGYTDAEYAVLPETEKFHQHITVYFLSPKAAELGQ